MMEDVIFTQILSMEWWHQPDLSEALDYVCNYDIHGFISQDSSKLTGKNSPKLSPECILKAVKNE